MDPNFTNNNTEQPAQDNTPAPVEPATQPMNDIQPQTPPAEPAESAQPLFPSASAPQTPANPDGVAYNMPPKSNKGLIIGAIAGVGALLIAGVIILIIVLTGGNKTDSNNGGSTPDSNNTNSNTTVTINSIEDFTAAAKNRSAVNCDITITDPGSNMTLTMTIQADNGWNNMRMKANLFDVNMVMIKEKDGSYTQYTWAMGQGQKKTIDASSIQDEIGFDTPQYDDTVKEIKCRPAEPVDVSLPSNIEFTEATMPDYDYDDDDDWDWDF